MVRMVGVVSLPLHGGKVPRWLFSRMVRLASSIVDVLVYEYGQDEFLRRLSNPFFFQSLSCVLGYDWHSSGTTTVTCGALKMALKPGEHGVAIAGGKGRFSRETPREVEVIGESFSLSTDSIERLKYSSRMAAKVDNCLLQAGYPLYHHSLIFNDKGGWAVIQQGFNVRDKTARRFHWLHEDVESFVDEPHSAIVCDVVKQNVLNMTAKESEDSRKISVELAREGPRQVKKDFMSLRSSSQRSLAEWLPRGVDLSKRGHAYPHILFMPRNLNWEVLRKVYEFQPRNYEELISLRGIGPATVRALALISEIIYGKPPSWRDPVKYSWAFGGKDGVPFPVDREAMDESIKFLREAVEQSKLKDMEKLEALKRLRSSIPKWVKIEDS